MLETGVHNMFSKYLISKFIKDYNNIKNEKVRSAYGYLGGIVGIALNALLFLVKFFVGLVTHSIAITADSFNNLTDTASSIITIVGFKLSNKPADEEHPFGHGRIEYLSALAVSFLIMLVGFQFIRESFNRILHPTEVHFLFLPFTLILASVIVKIWLSSFNKFIANSIGSKALKASSFDALADVIVSSITALSLLLSRWVSFPIDSYLGVVVSLFILYSGFSLTKDTLNPLLGEAPDPELVESIKAGILKYDHISGVHDLVIHNYGPSRCMASIHAEIPCDISVVTIHEIIDKAEKELSKELNIYLVIHMDPINTESKEVNKARELIEEILKNYSEVRSMHDFRVVGEGEYKNLIFDLVVEQSRGLSNESEDKLKKAIDTEVKKYYPEYNAKITIDKEFTVL